MQQSTACLHFCGIQCHCMTSPPAAEAVDWHVWQSCLVWCGGVNWPPDKCVLHRNASGGCTAPPDSLWHGPDTERTCLAVEPTQFTPPHQTRQNSPVCVVSGMAVWISFKNTTPSFSHSHHHTNTRASVYIHSYESTGQFLHACYWFIWLGLSMLFPRETLSSPPRYHH